MVQYLTRSWEWPTKLAIASYTTQPAPDCKEETKYTMLTTKNPSTTYFAFPGSHNAEDWKTNALITMRPLSAWADRLPDLEALPQLAHKG